MKSDPIPEADLFSYIDIPTEFLAPEEIEACLDTGAEKSVFGLSQVEAYYRYLGLPLVVKGSPHKI